MARRQDSFCFFSAGAALLPLIIECYTRAMATIVLDGRRRSITFPFAMWFYKKYRNNIDNIALFLRDNDGLLLVQFIVFDDDWRESVPGAAEVVEEKEEQCELIEEWIERDGCMFYCTDHMMFTSDDSAIGALPTFWNVGTLERRVRFMNYRPVELPNCWPFSEVWVPG